MSNNLGELINIKKFEQLCEKFAKLMGLSIALVDNETQIPYFAVSQTDVCKFFHKKYDISNVQCLTSNKRLTRNLTGSNVINIEMCSNGLIHSATPIVIEGKHMANLLIGQLFFDEPEMKFFEHQASEYSYNKDEYLQAVEKVPIIERETLYLSMSYLLEMAYWVAEIGTINSRVKESELKLKEQNVELQIQQKSILDNIPNIAWLKDLEGNYILVNKAFIDIMGLPKEQIIGKSDLEIFKDLEMAKTHIDQDREVIRTARSLKIDETLVVKNNVKNYFEIVKMPLVDQNGNISGTIGIAHDITERKKFEKLLTIKNEELLLKEESLTSQNQELIAKEETLIYQNEELLKVKEQLDNSLKDLQSTNLDLHDANTQKTKFLSSMSHELRTPLNAILGFTELLKKEYYGPLNEKQDDYIGLIQSSGAHLLSLINDILDIAKINAGSVEINYETFEINTLIIELVKLMQDQFDNKKVQLTYHNSINFIDITGDKRKYKQILFNLLNNALKFTSTGGQVDVYISEIEDNKIKITVQDNGIGISKEDKENIFNEFYQTSQEGKIKEGGTGIGLALTEKLVKIHGGTIGVISELNKGSIFWFVMPVNAQE